MSDVVPEGHGADDYAEPEHMPMEEEPMHMDEPSPFLGAATEASPHPPSSAPQPAPIQRSAPASSSPSAPPAKSKQRTYPTSAASPAESNALLGRLNGLGSKLKSLSDTSLSLPFNTLSTQEFGVAMRNGWLKKEDKRYHFTRKLQEDLDAYRHGGPARPERGPSRDTRRDERDRRDERTPVATTRPPIAQFDPLEKPPFDPELLPTTAYGARQLKIESIVYMGINKLNQPQIKLLGQDGTGQPHEVWNGIPLKTAQLMLAQHTKFQGKIILLDEKGNFAGIPLNPLRMETTPPPLPAPLPSAHVAPEPEQEPDSPGI